MELREFMRFHLLKALLAFVALQIIIVAIIQNYNHRPQAQHDQASMIEGRTVKVNPLSNDSDKDETDELSVKQYSTPLHGTVEKKGNILFYKPENGFVGADSLSYTASDGRKESKPTYITIQVNKNLEPLTARDLAESYNKGTIIIDVLKNDNDREGDSIFIKGFSQPLHGHLALVKNQLVYSADNSTAMADSFRYVISDGKSNSDSTPVCITLKSINDPCYPWLSSDVGDAARPGSFTSSNGKFNIEASGSDIWNNSDGMRYAYQFIDGDCEMYSKVESLEGSNEWAKAGVMIRESLSGGSKIAFVFVSTQHGINTHQRLTTNDQMQGGESNGNGKVPCWVKLIRKGNVFSYYNSTDGINWQPLGKAEVNMSSNVFIGFAVTSHNNNELAKAVFSNFRMTGKVVKLGSDK